MVNDYLSDLVARIKNGYAASLPRVEMPWTRTVEAAAKVLSAGGFVGEVKKEEKVLIIGLVYKGKVPAITDIKRVSKPGARIYSGVKNLPRVLGGLGMNILSTPAGVISDKQAKKLHVGGEILARVW